MNLHIQTYSAQELAQDVELEALLYRDFTLQEFSSMRDFLDGITGRKNLIILYAGWSRVLVARDEGVVVGWAAAYAPRGQPRERELNVFVSPSRRREGIGAELVRQMMPSLGGSIVTMENNQFFYTMLPHSDVLAYGSMRRIEVSESAA